MTAFDFLSEMIDGGGGFVAYWSILIVIALAETFSAAPAKQVAGRMKVNFGLGLLGAAVLLVPSLSAVALAEWANRHGIGLLNRIILPGWAGAVTAIVLLDLQRYALHRASHRWKPLWRLHQVHHGDPAVDLSTLFRQHPLSVAVITAADAATILALGLDPLGVMIYAAASLLVMPLAHAQLHPFPRLSRLVSLLVVTPRFHRQHHSALQTQTDSNYGELLTVWDRLFDTASMPGEVLRYGLGDPHDRDAGSLRRQLLLPFKPVGGT